MRSYHHAILIMGLCVALLPSSARAAGLATNDNFHVIAPTDELAREVLATAERLRDELAQQWLGETLPPGIGRTILHVSVGDESSGLFWAIDHPDRTFHQLWITLRRGEPTENVLGHELTHMVLATRYPQRLALWVEEGIASQADDEERKQIRAQTISWYRRTGNWPHMGGVLRLPSIAAQDQANYAVAASLTEYLLSRDDKRTLLSFAVEGKRHGWDRALAKHYGLSGVGELQSKWQKWVSAGDDLSANRATIEERTRTTRQTTRSGESRRNPKRRAMPTR